MSFRWPNKDPDEILDYSVDWSRYLGNSDIVSQQWFIDDESGIKRGSLLAGEEVNGLIARAFTISTDKKTATITLEGGYDNTEYKVYCKISFAEDPEQSPLTAERVIKLRVKER